MTRRVGMRLNPRSAQISSLCVRPFLFVNLQAAKDFTKGQSELLAEIKRMETKVKELKTAPANGIDAAEAGQHLMMRYH